MQSIAKAWFIRGKSDKGDGVMLLTASPITNSPLEVYSMLSLAVGHGRVNDLAIGTNGADGFMSAVSQMVTYTEQKKKFSTGKIVILSRDSLIIL